ncbi:MAG: amidohydrolase [Firmicutes bacterium]|nr:amidohydrolase [Bacillota bacterium]
MYQVIEKVLDEHSSELEELALKIWDTPEMAWKEEKACAWTAALLESYGFTVEIGAYQMPTAIRAVWGEGAPVVGFCGEYDCLPGLSQEVCPVNRPVIPGDDGHGCGHNLLGVGCVGACLGVKEALMAAHKPGTVIFYGCPAEEQMTGKGFMARAGAFKECDFTLAWHPSADARDNYGEHTGVEGAVFSFYGRTAHAAAAPENGRSALDAVQLMNMGVEFLREHVTSDVRIHYTITDGGLVPNIVPDFAASKFYVRALSREATKDTYARVIKCAEGAALMTDTKLKITHLGGLYPTLQNRVIGEIVQKYKKRLPPLQYTEEEIAFAKEMNRQSPLYKEEVPPFKANSQPVSMDNIYGSTDYGDVQHICPGYQVHECTAPSLTPGHSWMMTSASGSSIGLKGMLRAAKVMACAAYELMTDKEKLDDAKAEFRETMGSEAYECPVDETIPWPYN